MKDLIDSIAKSLVCNPQDVAVNQVDGETITILELRVAKEDLGKVIGKGGNTARAMRILLAAMSKRANGKRVVLEIIE